MRLHKYPAAIKKAEKLAAKHEKLSRTWGKRHVWIAIGVGVFTILTAWFFQPRVNQLFEAAAPTLGGLTGWDDQSMVAGLWILMMLSSIIMFIGNLISFSHKTESRREEDRQLALSNKYRTQAADLRKQYQDIPYHPRRVDDL